jgi:signal transduction histidine kinase
MLWMMRTLPDMIGCTTNALPEKVDTKRQKFSKNYASVLRRYLSPASLLRSRVVVRRMAERAARLRLTAADLADLHVSALHKLLARSPTANLRWTSLRKSGTFFKDVTLAAGELRARSHNSTNQLESIVEALTLRAGKLASWNEKLYREIGRRTFVEESLRVSEAKSSNLLAQSRRRQQELHQLTRQLLSTQEEERKRISRELHDVVAQALSSINLRLAPLKARGTATTKDLQIKIVATRALVEKSAEIVHRFACDLRPAVLDDLGLTPALRSHLNLVAAETGLRISFRSFAGIDSLGLEEKTAIYRICQQALTNVVQHAKAKNVKVRITQRLGKVSLVIQDDGCGFRPRLALSKGKAVHLGLLGMRERAEMIGGTFSVHSSPGKPTRIAVSLPGFSHTKSAKPPSKNKAGRKRHANDRRIQAQQQALVSPASTERSSVTGPAAD